LKIDNFALTMHQTCPAKYDLRMNEGWTSRRRSGALGFGSCLHEGLAAWYRTHDLGQALYAINDKWPESMPIDDFRTKEKCVSTMIEYVKQYPSETWTVVGAPENPVIEVPFTLDTGMYLPCAECQIVEDTPEFRYEAVCTNCGHDREHIEYGGIYDMLIEFGVKLFVVDHKTTSVMGSGYFRQFKPNNQMTGYIWAASKLSGEPVSGALINAVGIYKAGKTKFEREITSRSPIAIDSWMQDVYTECCNIQYHNIHGHWPKRTNACTLYGLCEYHSVHELDHPTEQAKMLEMSYVRDKWDYELRDG
jgi:hypothetical protein